MHVTILYSEREINDITRLCAYIILSYTAGVLYDVCLGFFLAVCLFIELVIRGCSGGHQGTYNNNKYI